MNRLSISYFLLAVMSVLPCSSLYSQEQVTQGYKMGWCYGPTSTECNYSFAEKKPVSAAICYEAQHASRLAGNQIDSIRFALQSTLRFDSLAVWVSASLDAEPMQRVVLPKKQVTKGWNSIPLPVPCVIQPHQDYYLGYTYYQSGEALVISTSAPVDDTHGCFWLKDADAAWQLTTDHQQTLSLEACLSGATLPQYDVKLLGISQLYDSIHSGQYIYVKAHLLNTALQPIHQVSLCVDAQSLPTSELMAEVNMPYLSQGEVCFKIETPADLVVEEGALSVSVQGLNSGKLDEWEADNARVATFSATPNLYVKNILVEEFTSEPCGNCPRVALMLEECLAQHPMRHHIASASYHVGFEDDWLTLEASRPYTQFFQGSSYNPAIMTDRTYCNGSTDIVWNPGNAQSILHSWASALARPTTVMLDASATHEGSLLRLQIRGFRSADYGIEHPRLTVMIVEDSIPAHYQHNGGRDWVHAHTARAISQTWGQTVTWSGDTFELQTTIQYPESVSTSHCSLLILLSEYGDQVTDRAVENVMSIPFPMLFAHQPSPSAIQTVGADHRHTSSTRSHDLMGRALPVGVTPRRGLNIENGKINYTY